MHFSKTVNVHLRFSLYEMPKASQSHSCRCFCVGYDWSLNVCCQTLLVCVYSLVIYV